MWLMGEKLSEALQRRIVGTSTLGCRILGDTISVKADDYTAAQLFLEKVGRFRFCRPGYMMHNDSSNIVASMGKQLVVGTSANGYCCSMASTYSDVPNSQSQRKDSLLVPYSMNQKPTRQPLLSRWFKVWLVLASFGQRHIRMLVLGGLSALFVVGIRLVLPWPLKALMKPWLGHASHRAHGLLELVPSGLDPVLAMGGLFLLLLFALGYMDFIARLYFARFAIGSIRDLRTQAFKKAGQLRPHTRQMGSGDLVARLIGDTARLKAGLKGFLVHVATNGVMLVGVTGVLLWLDVRLGLIFVVADILVVCVTAWGAKAMFRSALKFRTKEGQLADYIHESWQDKPSSSSFGDVNHSSGTHEASLTRIQGVTTWAAHVILGLAVVATLWLGTRSVAAGRIDAGDLFVVMMYGLMVRAPIVQLARQGARTGKIMACGERLERLLTEAPSLETTSVGRLQHSIRIEQGRVSTRRARKRIRRLGPIDLTITAGQRIAVLGDAGSGKTTLLELIAGIHPVRGNSRVLWDNQNLSNATSATVQDEIALMPHNPTWPRLSLGELLNLKEGTIDEPTRKLMIACGAKSLLKRLPNEFDTKVSSSELSPRERTAVALSVVTTGHKSLWLLDDPIGSLEKRKAKKLIKKILEARPGTTIVMSLNRPVRLAKFDRVILLKRGTIDFDGSPQQWRKTTIAAAAKNIQTNSNAESSIGEVDCNGETVA